jgi:hypothetical protein
MLKVPTITGFGDCLTMPEEVVALDNCDGRLIATLVGGRVVDLTDWFNPGAASKH